MKPRDFKRWRKSLGLSQKAAAENLGLKRRVLQYYEKGERDGNKVEIPKAVRLACYALSEGVSDYHGPRETPERLPEPALRLITNGEAKEALNGAADMAGLSHPPDEKKPEKRAKEKERDKPNGKGKDKGREKEPKGEKPGKASKAAKLLAPEEV